MPGVLSLRGASEHNLKGLDLDLPHGALIAICGVSGSGKSSLAFDTIHAECQRRFVEALSSFVRSQIGQAPRPACEQMTGLLPSIAVAQRGQVAPGPRATVATAAEIHDLLRVLYARTGEQFCATCGSRVRSWTIDAIVRDLAALPEGAAITIFAPVARQRTDVRPLLAELAKQGFLRVRIDGVLTTLDDVPTLGPGLHDVDLVVDRFRAGPDRTERLQEAVQTALKAGRGAMRVGVGGGAGDGEAATERDYATRPWCASCDRVLPELSPRLFSFNAPVGACPGCHGLGTVSEVDEAALVDPRKTLLDGAVRTWTDANRGTMIAWASAVGIAVDRPWSTLPWEARERVLHGDERTEGAVAVARKKLDEAWTIERACPACAGARLCPDARAVRVDGRSLPELLALTVDEATPAITALPDSPITAPLKDEMARRVAFLSRVGLGYLPLDRAAGTLSGGELQRLRLAAQVGNQLGGVLYVLDEPTAGLHPNDTERLVVLLRELVAAGNTVLVVDHDLSVLRAADLVVEVGPGAGTEGGRLTFRGTPSELLSSDCETGRWMSGRTSLPAHARLSPRRFVDLTGLSGRSLRGNARFPLGCLVGVAGPSGAGKSSLVFDTLAPAMAGRTGLPFGSIAGHEGVERIVRVDGSPLAKAGRSSVATASRIWEPIRQLLAKTPEAKVRGFGPERFSTATSGGRCEACAGEGQKRVAMHFLPDVVVPCDVCDGRRFDDATLAVTFRGYSASDLLRATVHEARAIFAVMPAIGGVLSTLDALGLGYLPLGQGVDTLSGGEAQRLKLARELGKPGAVEGALYLLDEPTVGLHPADVANLLEALRRLVTLGGSVIAVEHDALLLSACDWVIELGPGAGAAGGRVVAEGPPHA